MPENIIQQESINGLRIAKDGKLDFFGTDHFLHFFIHKDYLHSTTFVHENVMDFYLLLEGLLLEFPVYFRIEHTNSSESVISIHLLCLASFFCFGYLKTFCTFL